MAGVFYIYDEIGWLNTTSECPMGIMDVYEKEYCEKYPDADGTEPEFEASKPPPLSKMTEEKKLEWAYKVLKANEEETGIKIRHGDVVWIGGQDYRNEGIHFWDAKNKTIIPMTGEVCDYGHVPKRFVVGHGEGEFRSTHWDGISDYNNLEPLWSSEKNDWIYSSNNE